MNNIIPIFMTDSSIGKSILTSWGPEDKIKPNSPVSTWTIVELYNINPVYILENSFSSFVNHYEISKKLKKQLIFGVQFRVVENAKDKSEESFKTEHKVNIWMKNSNGYKDLIKLYSAAHAMEENFYYTGRLDYSILKEKFTDNLLLTIPYYGSFIHRNNLEFGHRSVPDFGNIIPSFHLDSKNLPFDNLLTKYVLDFCDKNKYNVLHSNLCYYYRDNDFKSFIVRKCISNRSQFNRPNINYLSSNEFSFETYCRKNNVKFLNE